MRYRLRTLFLRVYPLLAVMAACWAFWGALTQHLFYAVVGVLFLLSAASHIRQASKSANR